MRSKLLQQFYDKIDSHYVMTDRIPVIKELLNDRFKSGAYASLEGDAFAEAVRLPGSGTEL